jgi:transcriptional regulator with XRE-family HTH domain
MKKANSIDNYNKHFPSTLRKLIERKGTTITALATDIKVTRQAVSQYQDGSTQPNAETIVKIAKFFNVTTDYLLIGENRSVDESANIACDFTGLSQNAVDTLSRLKSTDKETVSRIIENKEFLDIISIFVTAQNNKDLLLPNGAPIINRISNILSNKERLEKEIISERFAVQIATRGLAPLYKQELIEKITTIFNELTNI